MTGQTISTGAAGDSEQQATHDIDLVIAMRTPPSDAARTLRAAFPEPRFYLDVEAIRDATGETRVP